MLKNIRNYVPEALIGLTSFLLLSLWAGSLTSPHYDEAYILIVGEQILNGEYLSLDGMTTYAGPIHQYLMALLFKLFGFKISVLRLTSAFFNSVGLVLMYVTLKSFFKERVALFLLMALLITSPMYIMTSRYAGEVQSLNIFFTALVLFFLMRGQELKTRADYFKVFSAGFFTGLLIYNHVIGVVLPIALAFGAIFFARRLPQFTKLGLVAFIGILVGLGARIYQFLFLNHINEWLAAANEKNSTHGLMSDIPLIPKMLSQILNGDILYRQFTGQELITTIPYLTTLFIIVVGTRLLARHKWSSVEVFTVIFVSTLTVLTIAISPNFQPHYFILPALFILIMMGLLAQFVHSHLRILVYSLFVLCIGLNVLYVSTNYFYAYATTNGKPGLHSLGHRGKAVSSYWVNIEPLRKQLIDRGIKYVVGNLGVCWPLRVVDFTSRDIKVLNNQAVDSYGPLPANTAYVVHNGTNVWYGEEVNLPNQLIKTKNNDFYRDESFDSNFRVYVNKAK